MILITGASGHYGKLTIEHLINKGVAPGSIVGLVREQSKGTDLEALGVQVRIGDYSDYASLQKAMRGAEKVLLVSGTDLENRNKQHENVINAAKEAGVRHVVYTSVERKAGSQLPRLGLLGPTHIHTEDYLKASGMAYTNLRNTIYLEFLPLFLGANVLDTGVTLPGGSGKAGWALRTEMAEATANILLDERHFNKDYRFSNPDMASFAEIAAILSQTTGKSVPYTDSTPEQYLQNLASTGVPQLYAAVFAGSVLGIADGELDFPSTDLSDTLGRAPTTIQSYLSQVFGKKD